MGLISRIIEVYDRIETSPKRPTAWMLFFSASHPEGGNITPANFRAFYCATGHATVADYEACLSAKPQASLTIPSKSALFGFHPSAF